MKIPFMLAGGGGATSDECTATAEDVLESKTAVYDGSDDEAEYGTMADYSGTSQSGDVTNNSSSSRVELTVPKRGLYSTASKIYTAFSTLASAISLTAAKIATGNTILGIAGTYTGLGSATQAQVLSGKTFSTASLSNASGTMTDKSGTSTSATSSTSGSNVRLQVPENAYYNTSAYLTNSYSNMASTIGLTAAKIKYGETILGITGTWNGYVATSTDLYYGGATGSLGGSFTTTTSASSASVTTDTACIVFSQTSGSSSGWGNNGIYFANSINMSGYSKLTLTWSMVTAPSSGNGTYPAIYIGVYTSKPTSSTLNPASYALLYASRYLPGNTSAGTTYTLSVDLSSVSQSLYVGAGFSTYSSTNGNFTANVTRIQLS